VIWDLLDIRASVSTDGLPQEDIVVSLQKIDDLIDRRAKEVRFGRNASEFRRHVY